MMYRKFAAFVLLSFIWLGLSSFETKPPKNLQKQAIHKIVIDAGHGGSDPGTKGKYSTEKDVSLAVALKLQKLLNDQIPEVETYMTRTTDIYDKVTVKAQKANAAKGDLFIAIHCNEAAPNRHSELIGYKTVTTKKKGKKITKKVPQYKTWTTPSEVVGTETYIWGIAKKDEKEKAIQESLSENDFIDSASAAELKNFNPTDPKQILAISLRTEQYSERSRNLALTVEEEFEKSGRVSRGAKQRNEKGIWVLQATNMPAILIEIGFLSNPEEEDYLNSESGQTEVANSIVKAIRRYKFSLDNKLNKPGKTNSNK